MKVNPVAGSAALLAGVLLVAGCGGSGGSGGGAGHPAQLTLGKEFPAVKAAALAATSVRMSGSVVQDGKALSLDMAFVKPSSAAGSVSQAGTSYTIVVTPAQDYIQISKEFLKAGSLPASLCARACGKYLEISSSSAAAFSGLSMGSMVSSEMSKDEAGIKLTAGQYRGQPAWTGSGGGETFYISKGSTPYLLSVSKNGQTVSFTGWDSTTIAPPPAGEMLTTAQLGQLAAGG